MENVNNNTTSTERLRQIAANNHGTIMPSSDFMFVRMYKIRNPTAGDDQIVAALDAENTEAAKRRAAWDNASGSEKIAHAMRID